MNREARRKMMKKFPGYRNALKETTDKAVKELERLMSQYWGDSDENLNEGTPVGADDGDDDVYNF